MKHLEFKVNSQTLKRLDSFKPAAGSVDYLTASFTFSEDWSGTAKTAKCRKDNAIYSAAINSSGVCLIPHEVLAQDETKRAFGGQEFYICVEGKSGTKTITTEEIKIELSLTGAGEAANAGDPTPELYAQYIADVKAETKENADTAAAAAESATTKATEAAASAASLKNDYSNALKGKASGPVIRVDDVAPVEHYPVVKVYGKNLISYGSITFTKNKNCLLDNPIPAGTYTISAKITSSDTDSEMSSVSINGENEVLKYISLKRNERVSATFTVTKPITNIDFCAGYNYSQGADDTATWQDIQIEKGETATEYTPYIDPTTITVSRHGKNIISLETLSQTPNTTTATFTDGILSIEGYLVSHRVNAAGLVGEALTISCESSRSGEKGGGLAIEFKDIDNNKISGIYKQNELSPHFSFTVPDNTYTIVVFFYASGNADDIGTAEYKNIQLEIGGSVTDFEAYNGAAYTPDTDGTIEGLTSISPTMTLLTDHEGITIDCEYNKDINKAFAKLEALLNN